MSTPMTVDELRGLAARQVNRLIAEAAADHASLAGSAGQGNADQGDDDRGVLVASLVSCQHILNTLATRLATLSAEEF